MTRQNQHYPSRDTATSHSTKDKVLPCSFCLLPWPAACLTSCRLGVVEPAAPKENSFFKSSEHADDYEYGMFLSTVHTWNVDLIIKQQQQQQLLFLTDICLRIRLESLFSLQDQAAALSTQVTHPLHVKNPNSLLSHHDIKSISQVNALEGTCPARALDGHILSTDQPSRSSEPSVARTPITMVLPRIGVN